MLERQKTVVIAILLQKANGRCRRRRKIKAVFTPRKYNFSESTRENRIGNDTITEVISNLLTHKIVRENESKV